MYILKARNRTTCRDDLISRFDDKRQFDYQIDKVNPETHSDAMILNDKGEVEKYVTLRKPYQRTLNKSLRTH